MGETLVWDSGDVWTSWRRVWQKGSFANHGCTGGQSWSWSYPDVEPNWKYNTDWNVDLYGYNVNVKNGARYNNNGRGNRGENYYRCERTGRNEHSTHTKYSS